MDEPGLDPGAHHEALDALARLNAWSGSARHLWAALEPLAAESRGRPLRVLDLATGGGDLPSALASRARRAGLELEVDGCDSSPVALEHARSRVPGSRFFRIDALEDELPGDYDVIVSSLFLHHLADEEAVALLARMRAAARAGVVLLDLDRSRIGLALSWLATRALVSSAVCRVDGPRSVRAAFTPGEARELARRARMEGATVARRAPARWLLTWWRAGVSADAQRGGSRWT